MSEHMFKIFQDSASINFYNGCRVKDSWSDRQPHYPILHRVLNFMKGRGFLVGRDPRIEQEYKSISKHHWYGRKGDLEFRAERYPVGWKIEFFQNVNFENRAGGYYDFDKYEKMPYMIKLIFRNEARYIKEFLIELGCICESNPVYKLAADRIKADYVSSCHHPQKSMEEFELSDMDGQTSEYSYNRKDRDGKIILNGQLKYFRDWNGRLSRGVVYRNLNNMWWVITHKDGLTNMADFQLFDPTPEDFKVRRLKKDRKPKEYLDRKDKLKEASTTELINELKRRGRKVS